MHHVLLFVGCNYSVCIYPLYKAMTYFPIAGVVYGRPAWALPYRLKLPVDAAHILDCFHRSAPPHLFEGGLQTSPLLYLCQPYVVFEVGARCYVCWDVVMHTHLVHHNWVILVESRAKLDKLGSARPIFWERDVQILNEARLRLNTTLAH